MSGVVGGLLVKGGAAGAGGLLSLAWRRLRPDLSYSALAGYADDLADQVRRRETSRLEHLGVTRGQGINVPFRPLSRVQADADGEDIGTMQEARPFYEALAPGRLVVLGEAGSGKTVLVMHLLLDLLDHRHDRRGAVEPVPVRVNAASWNTRTRFCDWLAQQIVANYGVLPAVARRLIDSGYVLPVLDGLDEMDPLVGPPSRARDALTQLNRPPWRGRPIILTCRTTTYEGACAMAPGGADAGLHVASLVSLCKLTPHQACTYLR